MHGEPAGRSHDRGGSGADEPVELPEPAEPAMPDPVEAGDPSTGAVDDAMPGVDAVLGREVAMVVLPPASGDELAARTERVRRLAGLHHPNLVDVFDVDGLAADTESTLVLQNVRGRGLDEVTGPWRAEPLARVGAQAAAGLAHAHAHDVVHGAIGAASVVVDAGLRAWLTGFTATLRPDTEPATGPDGGAPTPATDVAMLGRTLHDALGGTGPASLTTVLTAMIDGAVTAREAAERCTRVAETLVVGEEDTRLIPLPTRYTRRPDGATADGAPAPATGPVEDETTITAASRPDSVPIAVVPSPPPTPAAARAGGRRAGPRGRHGRRAALLGGAAVTVALASAFALWAGEGPSGPAPARDGGDAGRPTDQGRPAGGVSPADPRDRGVDTRPSSPEPGTDATRQDVLPGTGDERPAGPPAPPAVTVPPAPLPPRPPVPSSRPSPTEPAPTSTPPTSTPPTSTPPTSTPPSSTPTSPSPTTRTSRPAAPTATPPSSRGTERPDRPGRPGAARNPAALAAGR